MKQLAALSTSGMRFRQSKLLIGFLVFSWSMLSVHCSCADDSLKFSKEIKTKISSFLIRDNSAPDTGQARTGLRDSSLKSVQQGAENSRRYGGRKVLTAFMFLLAFNGALVWPEIPVFPDLKDDRFVLLRSILLNRVLPARAGPEGAVRLFSGRHQ